MSGVDHPSVILDDSSQVEGKILGVHLGSEAVSGSLLLASGDQDIIAADGQVAKSDRRVRGAGNARGSEERTSNVAKVDGGSLVVGNREDGVGRVAIDQLHTKDLRVGERNSYLDVQLGRLLLSGILNLLLDLGRLLASLVCMLMYLGSRVAYNLGQGGNGLEGKERECAELQRYHFG